MVGGSFANHPNLVPDPQWKEWTRINLPGSKNNWITDIDSVFRTRKGCVTIIETKRYKCRMKTWQRNTYGLLAGALKLCEGTVIEHPMLSKPLHLEHFRGVVELVFEKTWFNDGWFEVYLDGSRLEGMTEDGLIQFLKYGSNCCICYDPDECECRCN